MRGLLLLFLWAALIGVAVVLVIGLAPDHWWEWLAFGIGAWVWWDGLDALWATTKRYIEGRDA